MPSELKLTSSDDYYKTTRDKKVIYIYMSFFNEYERDTKPNRYIGFDTER